MKGGVALAYIPLRGRAAVRIASFLREGRSPHLVKRASRGVVKNTCIGALIGVVGNCGEKRRTVFTLRITTSPERNTKQHVSKHELKEDSHKENYYVVLNFWLRRWSLYLITIYIMVCCYILIYTN